MVVNRQQLIVLSQFIYLNDIIILLWLHILISCTNNEIAIFKLLSARLLKLCERIQNLL